MSVPPSQPRHATRATGRRPRNSAPPARHRPVSSNPAGRRIRAPGRNGEQRDLAVALHGREAAQFDPHDRNSADPAHLQTARPDQRRDVAGRQRHARNHGAGHLVRQTGEIRIVPPRVAREVTGRQDCPFRIGHIRDRGPARRGKTPHGPLQGSRLPRPERDPRCVVLGQQALQHVEALAHPVGVTLPAPHDTVQALLHPPFVGLGQPIGADRAHQQPHGQHRHPRGDERTDHQAGSKAHRRSLASSPMANAPVSPTTSTVGPSPVPPAPHPPSLCTASA